MKRLTKGRLISFLTALVVSANTWGAALTIGDYGKDVESIKKMTGCYKVTFQNAETFSLSEVFFPLMNLLSLAPPTLQSLMMFYRLFWVAKASLCLLGPKLW